MKISRAIRRFHDPWGNRSGGNLCDEQWRVGQAGRISGRPDAKRWAVDWTSYAERASSDYVKTGKRGIEKLKR